VLPKAKSFYRPSISGGVSTTLRKILTVVCLVAFGAVTFVGCTPQQAAKDQGASQQQPSASGKAAKTSKDKKTRKKAPPHVTTAK
jgi:hypothetical protein